MNELMNLFGPVQGAREVLHESARERVAARGVEADDDDAVVDLHPDCVGVAHCCFSLTWANTRSANSLK